MFKEIKEINSRPKPFQFYTANELWTNEHTAKQMLQCHLNADIDVSSRNHAFIKESVNWLQHFSPSMLKQEFNASSFQVEALFADVAGQAFNPESNEMAIVARK